MMSATTEVPIERHRDALEALAEAVGEPASNARTDGGVSLTYDVNRDRGAESVGRRHDLRSGWRGPPRRERWVGRVGGRDRRRVSRLRGAVAEDVRRLAPPAVAPVRLSGVQSPLARGGAVTEADVGREDIEPGLADDGVKGRSSIRLMSVEIPESGSIHSPNRIMGMLTPAR